MTMLRNVWIALVMLLPLSAYAQAPRTYRELVSYLITIMNYSIGTLIVLGLVLYFYGIASGIMKGREGDAKQQRGFLLMGIITIFVMVSVWGIIRILRATFF